MSPYPVQVTKESIIETAWEMIEADGSAENLPVSRLAGELGIKAPSLYRHFANKSELLHGVNIYTRTLMFDAMNAILEAHRNASPSEQLVAVCLGYRAFGHAHPATYTLAFTPSGFDTEFDEEGRMVEKSTEEEAQQFADILRLQSIIGDISGEAESLTALRGLLALAHGFVTLEINQQLRRGGDLEEAFEKSVRAYLRGWQHKA